MKRSATILTLFLLAAPAQAHFIWLAPHDGKQVRMVFSEDTEPDPAVPIAKIAQTQVHVRSGVKPVAAEKTAAADHYLIAVPGGPAEVGAVCEYGVLAKSGDPFLLCYYAKTLIGAAQARGMNHPLEIYPVAGGAFEVRWQGKPLAGAEVVIDATGQDTKKTKSDGEGRVSAGPVKSGMVLLRAKHIEAKAGDRGGKEFKEIRHYATLTVTQANTASEDPAATKLLAEARAARAVWEKFPGFSADLVVNRNGQLVKTNVAVDAKGKVQLRMEDGDLKDWTRRQVASLVAHRLPGATELSTPCAFADPVMDHPQGRTIRVLNDELHSSYRIRDKQILEVNRAMGETRFTITVLENLWTKEKQYLPVAYVVNTWDAKSNQLRSSAAHHDTWTRVGAYDLPLTIGIVTATSGQLESRSLTFANHRLGGSEGQ